MPQPADLVAAARAAGITEQPVLDAIAAVPRADFVPPEFVERAYDDAPLPIPHDLVTTQPSLVAQVVAALELTSFDRVLEIGTGYGWQTALLARPRRARLERRALGRLGRHRAATSRNSRT